MEEHNLEPELDITLTVKARHADLYAAAKRLGSVAALARHLGISQSELGQWCNLGGCPALGTKRGRWKDPVFVAEIEKKLFDLTGKTLDDLFPQAIRGHKEFWDAEKTVEITRSFSVSQLEHRASAIALLPGPDELLADEEAHSKALNTLEKILKSLSHREREVLKLRFGLGSLDGCTYTLEEVGRIFKVTKDRIRQIEARAMNKLQSKVMCSPELREALAPFISDDEYDNAALARRLKARQKTKSVVD